MKRIFNFLVLLFLLMGGAAQPGSITIKSNNFNQRFWVFIDDVLQNQYSVNSIRIAGMNIQQPYRLRIEMDSQDYPIVGRTILVDQNSRRNSFEIQYRSSGFILKNSFFNVNPMVTVQLIRPNYNYSNAYYSFLYPGFGSYGNYWGSGGNQHYLGNNYGNYPGSGYPGGGNYPGSGYPGGGNHPGSGHPGGHHGGGNYNPPPAPCMPTVEFNQALQSIQSNKMESCKLSTAKQVAARNSGRICTDQILQITRIFSFESDKLEFAKFAYNHCSDKANYYRVADAFSFQSTKEELFKFIKY